jgi:hypothetical protein
MTEEENEQIEETPVTTDEPSYTGKYCNSDEVLALFEDISDDPSDNLLKVSIDNTEAWIESNLKRHYVPIPTDIPQTLKTIAIYYASSDILMSLYHGETYQSLMDYWFNKAQDLLGAYIDEYLNSDASEEEQVNNQMVKHSNALTYNERRRLRGWEKSRI